MTKSTWKEMHINCPMCESTDAYCVDHKGAGYCFSCEGTTPPEGGYQATQEAPMTKQEASLKVGGSHEAIPSRKLSKASCEFFDVKTMDDRFIFPYHDSTGTLVAQKMRFMELNDKGKKSYPWVGTPKQSTLFGQNKWSSGNTITIVEGEFDAVAYRDLMGDYPVVSVKNGAQGAFKDVRENLDFFKGFNEIKLCFDADEHGRKAALQVAELFPIGTVSIVNLRHYKDANEYLENGARNEFSKCWWNPEAFTPAGIESANAGGFESLFEDIDTLELFPYPFNDLNEKTFGIRKSEMVTVVSGSGVGKSAFVAEVSYKLLTETKKKIGMLMLEESPKKTKLRMMSMYLGRPLHLTLLGRLVKRFDFLKDILGKLFTNEADYEWSADTKKELEEAWDNVIERKADDGNNQLWLFNHFGSNSIDTIVNKIDQLVTGLGCEFIILDHVSIVVSDQQNADERKALDELSTKLRTLVERRNFALIIVSHLRRPGGKPHEEGGETSLADIRGTAGIGQLSDVVIGLERNGQHPDDYLKNITKMRVLKNRFSGITGLASYAHYDIETGRLEEVDKKEIEAMFEQGSQAGDDGFEADISEWGSEDKPLFDSTAFGTQETERNTGT